MASKKQRALALIIAVLFFATSVATTGLVLWQMQEEKDQQQALATIQEELNANVNQTPSGENMLKGTKLENFTPVSSVESLQITDVSVGSGAEAKPGAVVTAHYTGALAKDGTIFESSKDAGQPATFPLAQVIQGWQEGVPGMKEGGVRRLIIPAAMAYGEAGAPPTIGPNEPLVFDIELVKVEQ